MFTVEHDGLLQADDGDVVAVDGRRKVLVPEDDVDLVVVHVIRRRRLAVLVLTQSDAFSLFSN